MKERYFIIQNSINIKEYLHPYPFKDSKQYVFNEGLLGAAGFYQEEAFIIAKSCTPPGNVIPLDSIAKKIIKE